jgi:predicted PurR-regulated permease PerM
MKTASGNKLIVMVFVYFFFLVWCRVEDAVIRYLNRKSTVNDAPGSS